MIMKIVYRKRINVKIKLCVVHLVLLILFFWNVIQSRSVDGKKTSR